MIVAERFQFFGIQHVFVSDLLEKRALAALHFGAKHIVLPDQEDMLKSIKEKTGTIPKIVFDCVDDWSWVIFVYVFVFCCCFVCFCLFCFVVFHVVVYHV